MSEGLNRESFTEEIEGLDIPEDYKSKIRDCVANLFNRNQKLLKNLKLQGSNRSNIHNVLHIALKWLTGLIDNVLPVPKARDVVTGVAKFFAFCCEKLLIIHAVRVLASREIFIFCKQAVLKLDMSISYCIGVFRDLAHATTDVQRDAIVRPVPSEVPVLVGAGEMSVLQFEIQDLLLEANVGKFDELMSKVELYCAIATLRELVLSLRMVIQSLNCGCITGIFEVLKKQWKDSEELLSFLYKPNQENLKLHLEYLNNTDWPIVGSFLETRHLHTDDMSYLDGTVSNIVSAEDPNLHLSLHDCSLFFCMRGNTTTEGAKTRFIFEHCGNNTFAIRCCQYLEHHVSSHAWTRADRGEPNHPRGKWRVVKIYGRNNDESDIFVFDPTFVFVPTSSRYQCLYIDSTGRVHDKAFNPSDKRCFWKLRHQGIFSVFGVNSCFHLGFLHSRPLYHNTRASRELIRHGRRMISDRLLLINKSMLLQSCALIVRALQNERHEIM